MREFEINHNGNPAKIKIDDKPTAGDGMMIARLGVEKKGVQIIPRPDEFFIAVCTRLIKEAPWTLQNPDALRSLPFETYEQLVDKLIEANLWMERFLSPEIKLMYGKRLEAITFPSQTESITFSPSGG